MLSVDEKARLPSPSESFHASYNLKEKHLRYKLFIESFEILIPLGMGSERISRCVSFGGIKIKRRDWQFVLSFAKGRLKISPNVYFLLLSDEGGEKEGRKQWEKDRALRVINQL